MVKHSDTLGAPFGYGSYGSRSGAVGGTAIVKAAEKIREKAKTVAAHMLEASVDDIDVRGRQVLRDAARRTRSRPSREIAFATDLGFDLPEGVEPFLDETAYYDAPNCTWPFGTHIAIVEVDAETGHVDVVRYIAVDDVGKKINPLIVDGQLHGGIAQGVGQALWEHAVYDDERPAAVRLDARLRAAAGVVAARRSSSTRRSRRRPSTRWASRASVRRAPSPAPRPWSTRSSTRSAPLGIRHVDMPLTDQTVWRAIARRGGDPRMIPAHSTTAPVNLEEALRILAEGHEGTKVINGGQSLLPLLKLRLAEVDRWSTSVDCPSSRASGEGADGGVVIGGAVTYREVLDSALVAERAPLLMEVIEDIGDVQVRNRGTLGGSSPTRTLRRTSPLRSWRWTPRSCCGP